MAFGKWPKRPWHSTRMWYAAGANPGSATTTFGSPTANRALTGSPSPSMISATWLLKACAELVTKVAVTFSSIYVSCQSSWDAAMGWPLKFRIVGGPNSPFSVLDRARRVCAQMDIVNANESNQMVGSMKVHAYDIVC